MSSRIMQFRWTLSPQSETPKVTSIKRAFRIDSQRYCDTCGGRTGSSQAAPPTLFQYRARSTYLLLEHAMIAFYYKLLHMASTAAILSCPRSITRISCHFLLVIRSRDLACLCSLVITELSCSSCCEVLRDHTY